MRTIACLFAAFALIHSTSAAETRYPRADMLLEAAELAKPETARQFVILDARSRGDYDQAHVPGAHWIDNQAWKTAFGSGSDAAAWGKRIGELGISATSKVVVYDDNLSKDAARMWWILRYWGVDDARLLNGGWAAWKQAGIPTQSKAPPQGAVVFKAQPRSQSLATKGSILKRLASNSLQVVDARSTDEYCGLAKLSNRRGGAIPGAKHLEWVDLIDKETQRFKSAEELSTLFREAGIDLERPTATHCQSGGRSSVMAFGLELMGAKDVSNYYAGWSEWGNAEETPIEPGKK